MCRKLHHEPAEPNLKVVRTAPLAPCPMPRPPDALKGEVATVDRSGFMEPPH